MAQQKSTKSDTPAGIDFNFDTFEQEEPARPYVTTLGGKRVSFSDPRYLDWQDLMASLRNPYAFFKITVADEGDRTRFLSAKINQGTLNAFMGQYLASYDMKPDEGALPGA